MRKRWAFLLCLVLAASLLASGCALAEKTGVNIAVLKGPTGMGAAPLMAWNEAGETDNAYAFTIAGAPDALTGMLITGELDMAALPFGFAPWLALILAAYCLSTQLLKNVFIRRYGQWL